MTEIRYTEPAQYDLVDIDYYIWVKLGNPTAAENTINGIKEKIKELRTFPDKHKPVPDDLLAKLGICMTWYRNYNIFYYYDKSEDIIHIIRVLNNRANWKDILK